MWNDEMNKLRRSRMRAHSIFMWIVALIIGAAFLFAAANYRECRADGYASYQCTAMVSGYGYVVVDTPDGTP